MHYDIAIKRLMELGGAGILREVVGLDVTEVRTLDELPQEQTAVLRCDYAAEITASDGSSGIVILEFQTRWDEAKLLDLVAYTVQRMRRHDLPVTPVMLLFNAHPAARGEFQRGPLRQFEFRLVKVWELEAQNLLATPQPWLWALSPLARDGVACAEKVDTLLHQAPLSQAERSDLLTIFTIFMSMRDKEVTRHIIHRRRQLMIESPFYEMIKEEGREEGLEKGREEGIHIGELRAQRASLIEFLQALETSVPAALIGRIEAEADLPTLRRWYHAALRSRSVAEVRAVMGA